MWIKIDGSWGLVWYLWTSNLRNWWKMIVDGKVMDDLMFLNRLLYSFEDFWTLSLYVHNCVWLKYKESPKSE